MLEVLRKINPQQASVTLTAISKANKFLESMSSMYVHKFVLLKASDLYHKSIPEGDDFLLKYCIDTVNSDYKTPIIEKMKVIFSTTIQHYRF